MFLNEWTWYFPEIVKLNPIKNLIVTTKFCFAFNLSWSPWYTKSYTTSLFLDKFTKLLLLLECSVCVYRMYISYITSYNIPYTIWRDEVHLERGGNHSFFNSIPTVPFLHKILYFWQVTLVQLFFFLMSSSFATL